MKTGLALGANLGDRLRHLQQAKTHLQSLSHGGWLLTSAVYETEPLDCPPDSPAFFNAVVEIDYDGTPRSLLEKIHDYENAHGRDRNALRNAPRLIDIDILCWGDTEIREEDLVIPHPRLTQRRFVLLPLSTMRPELVIQGTGKTAAILLRELPQGGGSVKLIQKNW